MTVTANINLASLLGSRICHDLISPLGAIGNGLELLSLSGVPETPELTLIRESVENANARIGFFRLAFGAAPDGQQIPVQDVIAIIGNYARSSRVRIAWQDAGNPGRPVVRLIFLLIQCLERALPFGGEITIRHKNGGWCVTGQGDKLRIDPQLWSLLTGGTLTEPLHPADIQFALIRNAADDCGVVLTLDRSEGAVAIRF